MEKEPGWCGAVAPAEATRRAEFCSCFCLTSLDGVQEPRHHGHHAGDGRRSVDQPTLGLIWVYLSPGLLVVSLPQQAGLVYQWCDSCRNDFHDPGLFFLQGGCEQTSFFTRPWQLVVLLRCRFLLPKFRHLTEAPETGTCKGYPGI